MEDMPGSGPEFHQRRQTFPLALKFYFDEIDYTVALHEIWRGLRRFTQVCQLVGIIKPLPYGDLKLIY